MELNNSLFIVQKSIDSTNFNDIAVIASKAKNGNSSTQLNYSFQIFTENTQADMHYVVLIMSILAAIALISKLNKVYKSLILGIVCLFLFSCTKSVSVPINTPTHSATGFRLKQVDLDGHINYSEIKLVN